MTVDSVGDGVCRPRVSGSIAVILATKVENFVLECLFAIPAVSGQNAAVSDKFLAPVDSEKGDIIWAIAKLSCTVHGANGNPIAQLSANAKTVGVV
jgi:hypothetical protein